MAKVALPLAPAVTFSLQATISNFPSELHECIDMTPALSSWARQALPVLMQGVMVARAKERAALDAARGQEGWIAASGPTLAIHRDAVEAILTDCRMLADGICHDASHGWVARSSWTALVRLAQQLAAEQGAQ